MAATLSKIMLLGGFAVLFLAGCVSLSGDFQTKRDASYHGTIGRVLIVSLNEDFLAQRLKPDFSKLLLARVTQSLSAKGVVIEVVHPNMNDLDPTAPVKSAAKLFHPGHVLSLGITQFNQFNSHVTIVFTFSLVDTQSGKIIWRGTDQFGVIPSPEEVADPLIKQLETEQLL